MSAVKKSPIKMELVISLTNDNLITRRNRQGFNLINNKIVNDFVYRKTIPENIADLAAGDGLVGLVKYLSYKDLKVGQDGVRLGSW